MTHKHISVQYKLPYLLATDTIGLLKLNQYYFVLIRIGRTSCCSDFQISCFYLFLATSVYRKQQELLFIKRFNVTYLLKTVNKANDYTCLHKAADNKND